MLTRDLNLLDRIDEIRVADNHVYYTSYHIEDLVIDGNLIKLKHLLETEIEHLSLDVSAILNISIIVTDHDENASVISSFIEDVSICRIKVNDCSDQDLDVDEIESELLDRFNASTLSVRIVAKEIEHTGE